MADPPVNLVLLGPVRLERSGAPVPALASARLRALLVRLVLAGAPVDRGILCGLFWPDVPEERARLSLRVALSRLREALPGRVHSDRRAVAFVALAHDDVDVRAVRPVLEALAAPGRTSLLPEATAAALQRLVGPLAADLDGAASEGFAAWLAEQRAAWDALAAAALARVADGDSALLHGTLPAPDGKGDQQVVTRVDARSPTRGAIALLREAVRRDPLDASLARRLMLATARAGDYDAALAEHARLVQALAERAGLTPDAATDAVRDQIMAARGRGRRHNLPPPSGRVAETPADFDRLARWLGDPARRLIVLVGAAAADRSRLARDAAELALDAVLDGVVWVGRTALETDPGLGARLAAALAEVDGQTVLVARIGEHLAGQERIVVVDGLSGDPSDVAALGSWIAAAPGVRFLVARRDPLGFVFEHRFSAAG